MISSIDKQVAMRVRRLRDGAGLSLDAAASMSGLDQRVYAASENGRRRFQSHELLKLTKGLNISISELYRGLPQAD